jgi:beta-lactamase class A
MLREKYTATKSWATRHPRRFFWYVIGSVVGLLLLVQLFYPAGTLLPFSTIEQVPVGGMSKRVAIKKLDETFASSKVAVYFKGSDTAFFKASSSDIGVTASNKDRIGSVSYPWFLRLVPTSLWWGHVFTEDVAPLQYNRNTQTQANFIMKTFGDSCLLEVRNATAEVKDKEIKVVEAFSGGDCDFNQLTSRLSSVKPTVQGARVDITGNEVRPKITTQQAEKLASHVTDVIDGGIKVDDGKEKHTIPKELLRSWLDFAAVENKLDYSFSVDRSASYLGERIASKVEKPAGTTKVTLLDFSEGKRDEGESGVTFNRSKMLSSIKTSLEKNERTVDVQVDAIAPNVTYTRTDSPADEKLSTLIKQFASTHPGTYGVSLRDVSGHRNASYRAATVYTTASTYKMFVAYSTLLRVESGEWQWSDYINGGRDLTQCFEDMIQLSDNECAVALLKKVSVKVLTDEAHAIGAKNTSFLVSNDIKSTPEDESLLLGLLYSKQILRDQASRDIWIDAMKKNVYRQGIPKGIPSATVADKVGFLDAYLHDAAIVYSPKGSYVLVIMTEGSSWGNIAELASQIETLRTR